MLPPVHAIVPSNPALLDYSLAFNISPVVYVINMVNPGSEDILNLAYNF